MKKAIVFSMEEFAIHDGPGIRTTIFLKGCPLRCMWCHNPEGISPRPQYMNKKGEISLCGYEVTTDELARQVLKNKDIYTLNQGGITLTGGEPLMQSAFILELVEKLEGVHVAIETSGYASEKVFRKTIASVDLVMMDIKHADALKHKQYTGVSNEQILKNLNHLIASGKEFIARIPLIPGVNDDEENMRQTAELLKEASSLQRVELMPYHQTAGAKYTMIGSSYLPTFDTTVRPQVHTDIFKAYHINTIVL